MKITNQKGFSLVEVMITGGILCVVAFGYMKFMDQQARSEKGRRASAEAEVLHSEIRGYLGKQGSCTNSFKDKGLSEAITESIKKPNGKDKYKVGTLYGNRLVKIASIKIRSFDTDTDEGLMGTGVLEIIYEKQGKIVGGKHLKREINLDILIDENDKILECATIGNLNLTLSLGDDGDDSETTSSDSSESNDNDSSQETSGTSSASAQESSPSSTQSNSPSVVTNPSSASSSSSSSSSSSGQSESAPSQQAQDAKQAGGVTAQKMQQYLEGNLQGEDAKKVDAIFKSNKNLQQLKESIKAMQKQNAEMNKFLEDQDN